MTTEILNLVCRSRVTPTQETGIQPVTKTLNVYVSYCVLIYLYMDVLCVRSTDSTPIEYSLDSRGERSLGLIGTVHYLHVVSLVVDGERHR